MILYQYYITGLDRLDSTEKCPDQAESVKINLEHLNQPHSPRIASVNEYLFPCDRIRTHAHLYP